MCPQCRSARRGRPRARAGRGTVYSWILSHHPTRRRRPTPDRGAGAIWTRACRLVSNLVEVEPDRGPQRHGRRGRASTTFDDVSACPSSDRRRPRIGGEWRTLGERSIIAGIGQTEFSKNSGRSHAPAGRRGLAGGHRRRRADARPTSTARSPSPLDTNDELALIRTPRASPSCGSRPAPGAAAGAPAPPCSTRRPRWRRGRRTPCWSAGRSTSGPGTRFGQPDSDTAARPEPWNWYLPFGLDTPAKVYGLTFQRYMHRYGLTNADFGRYTVVARALRRHQPDAWFYERPITLEDHQGSRWIVEPILRLLDCCQESDGGVALVVTTADRAGDLPNPPVRIEAAVQAPPGRRRRDVQLLPRGPGAVPRGPGGLAAQIWRVDRTRRPTTSTSP